jgi:hypothetical protein
VLGVRSPSRIRISRKSVGAEIVWRKKESFLLSGCGTADRESRKQNEHGPLEANAVCQEISFSMFSAHAIIGVTLVQLVQYAPLNCCRLISTVALCIWSINEVRLHPQK